MRLPNKYGGIVKNGGNRRKPFQARRTTGYDDEGKQLYETIGFFEKREDAITALAQYNNSPYDITSRKINLPRII